MEISENMNEKILQYEKFLNETLRGDLAKVTKCQEKLLVILTNYRDIQTFINSIKEDKFDLEGGAMKTKVDLGCNFFVNAKISDHKKIVLSVGLNFFVEMNLDEALRFIEKKEQLLIKENDLLIQKSCKIKANIKLVLDALRKLQNITISNEPASQKHLNL